MKAELTISEREHRLLYSCIVAGKSATFTDGVMGRLAPTLERHATPLQSLAAYAEEEIRFILEAAKSGNYGKLARCFHQLAHADINLLTCIPADLERIHGIGPKTSRFFILWTRPGERYAALDVHVLRWLRENGYEAPRSTPLGAKYRALEVAFLNEADKRGMTPRELDSRIWEAASSYATAPARAEGERGGG